LLAYAWGEIVLMYPRHSQTVSMTFCSARGLVPVQLVRGNVIRANFRSLLPETGGNGQQDYDD
jgi:hypothetical protein